jgi:hypothetical protein
MRTRIVALIATLAFFAAVPAAQPFAQPAQGSQIAVVAKPCSSGYKHAIIGGEHKCLRRGQYCARSRDREYHRYGYHCHTRDRNGDYHLS